MMPKFKPTRMWKPSVLRLGLALLLSLPALSLAAEEVVTPDEFQKLSESKTLYFTYNGELFGIEQFYKRRRSTWQYSDGECVDGTWHPDGDMICFAYKGEPEVQCWHFLKTEDGYAARAEGADPELDLQLSFVDTTPLDCKGPSVGA